jgi:hypothetical protein
MIGCKTSIFYKIFILITHIYIYIYIYMVTKLALFFKILQNYINSNKILHKFVKQKEGNKRLNKNMNNCIYFRKNLNYDGNFTATNLMIDWCKLKFVSEYHVLWRLQRNFNITWKGAPAQNHMRKQVLLWVFSKI